MKRISRLLIRLYPAWWRNRYRGELEALLEDSGSHDVWDLFRAAMEVQMKTWSFGRIVTAGGILGLGLSAVAVFSLPYRYQSTATLKIDQADAKAFARVTDAAFTRSVFSSIIQDYGLYRRERMSMPLDDVIDKIMSREIHVTPVAPNFAQVSFAYEDPIQAQRVNQELVARIMWANVNMGVKPSGLRIELDQPVRLFEKHFAKLGKAGLGLPLGLLVGVVLALILRRRAPAP